MFYFLMENIVYKQTCYFSVNNVKINLNMDIKTLGTSQIWPKDNRKYNKKNVVLGVKVIIAEKNQEMFKDLKAEALNLHI